MAFSPLGNYDHVVVSVSIDFPSNYHRDTLFHRTAYNYSCADWDGLRDFVSGFRLDVMHISLIENTRLSLTHFHGFQLLVLQP